MLGSMGQIGPAKEPFEIIHIDTKSGFKKYGSRKDHLHLAIDALTRFAWFITSTKKTSMEFIQLINKIADLKHPPLIVSDNYPSLKGSIFKIRGTILPEIL